MRVLRLLRVYLLRLLVKVTGLVTIVNTVRLSYLTVPSGHRNILLLLNLSRIPGAVRYPEYS